MCFRLARYFLWPFGKFVHQYHKKPLHSVAQKMSSSGRFTPVQFSTSDPPFNSKEVTRRSLSVDAVLLHKDDSGESVHLLQGNNYADSTETGKDGETKVLWKMPGTYIWLLLGMPVLAMAHALIFLLTWFLVVTIPIAKINGKTITKILFTAPDEIRVGYSGQGPTSDGERHSEIIMYTHQSFNVYYYKYTVDGVNVILANLLVFVVLSIVIGYADEDNKLATPITKCVLGILAILPVTYYIGMAITSISAQSSFAVGAILNATFGSMVEVILFILMLKKGKDENETCYVELVKSTLTGSILCCILLVPGLSMVIGGLKYRRQNFNPRSANISSSLLFVAFMGVFAPTIFSKIYGNLECEQCEPVTENSTFANETGFLCSGCKTVITAPNDDMSLYTSHIKPLLYTCATILPMSYIIGLLFFMKTHTAEVFEEFEMLQKEEGEYKYTYMFHRYKPNFQIFNLAFWLHCYFIGAGGHHANAQWSRIKSGLILLLSVTAIALCADMIANNIAPLLNATGMSEYFVGVTLLSIVSMLPEIVNGVGFALQNNVNLGIEIGSAAAIQVCMVQLPILVLTDLVYPLGFGAIFNDIHLWAVILAVIIINYVFQDGKSDYFQGSIVMFIYILLMAMYYFTVTPDTAVCKNS
ncbi:cation/h+ exchanger protein 1 [Plakobranchus ocellatus]|uniref:Cation/h+ exchanger protein 1 n=1 Tax=Plakobranchus ocellatus TaxID=259542 RepID=A0AAV3YBB8_9GAST|nr:cation/h+ exchanger protein 1 [Plakobranchus ocellatus]